MQRFAQLARRVIYRLLRSQPGKPQGLHFSFSPGRRSWRHCRPRWHGGTGSWERVEIGAKAALELISGGSEAQRPCVSTWLGHPHPAGSLENINLAFSGTAGAQPRRVTFGKSLARPWAAGPAPAPASPAHPCIPRAPREGPWCPRSPGNTRKATQEQKSRFILKLLRAY